MDSAEQIDEKKKGEVCLFPSAAVLVKELLSLGCAAENISVSESGCDVGAFSYWVVEEGIEFYGPSPTGFAGDVIYWGTFRTLEELGALVLAGAPVAMPEVSVAK